MGSCEVHHHCEAEPALLDVMKQVQHAIFDMHVQALLRRQLEPGNTALVCCRSIGQALARVQLDKREEDFMDQDGWKAVEEAARKGDGWAVIRLRNESRVSGYDAMDA